MVTTTPTTVDVPDDLEQLAFAPVTVLANLIATRQVTSMQLTEMYLGRIKRFGPQLACVATLTEELAREQAAQADAEIAAGQYRGPLHGIPCGVKDLLATRRYPTGWGAPPYRGRQLGFDATVVERLAEAGAVIIAKLSMGSLAWGDVWYGGKTKSPWDLTAGSSGSSAGSGSATAAGLVGFAIGTETNGSIVSPCTECGVTGLRPTFGRVSRHGAMALAWTLDKIGPMCRSVADCALVFDAIRGPDAHDASVVDAPFAWEPRFSWEGLRLGYLPALFDAEKPVAGRRPSDARPAGGVGRDAGPLRTARLSAGRDAGDPVDGGGLRLRRTGLEQPRRRIGASTRRGHGRTVSARCLPCSGGGISAGATAAQYAHRRDAGANGRVGCLCRTVAWSRICG